MQFSIDKTRLEDFQSRFKVANGITNDAFERLRKAESVVASAEHTVSRMRETRGIPGTKEQRESAENALVDAERERDRIHEQYVEASRVSGYFGSLLDRCQRYADKEASAACAATRGAMEEAAVAASNAAHDRRMRDRGDRQ